MSGNPGLDKHVGPAGTEVNNTRKTRQKISLLHAFLKNARLLAFIAVTFAGIGSNFGSLDYDELSSPDFGVEQSALPAAFEGSESVVLQKQQLIPRTESRMLFRHGLTTTHGVPQSLQNFYCWYEHIPERGPPLLL